MHAQFTLLLAPLILAGAALAQAPQNLLGELRLPLHSSADDEMGGGYGLWAAGPDYKASFHDGFAFYPRRGPDHALVALRWQTTAIRCGGKDLLTAAPRAHSTDWRHELHYGPVTEAYDVLRAGVEQSFVLAERIGSGDVVVSGRIEGGLQARELPAACQALEFSDGETAVVRYGAAVAFDARGARTEVTTSYDGTHIHLTLAGDFLAGAVFPVTIDPLTTALTMNHTAGAPLVRTAIGIDNSASYGKVLMGYTSTFAAGDDDLLVVMLDKDFTNPIWVFADITAVWSTTRVDIAHVDGADRFTVAFQREYSATSRAIRIYFHEQANSLYGSGTLVQPASPPGTRWQEPRVGGSRGTGARALIVFEEDSMASSGSSNATRALCLLTQPTSAWFGPAISLDLSPGFSDDNEDPAIVPSTLHQGKWAAVWRKWSPATQLYSIRLAQIEWSSSVRQNDLILSTPDRVHTLAIAGSRSSSPDDGQYLAAWIRNAANGQSVEVRSIDQAAAGPATVGPVRTVTRSSLNFFGNIRLAHDWATRSHWALTWSRSSLLTGTTAFAARLGYTGGVTESQTLTSSGQTPVGLSVGYLEPGGMQRFLLVHGLMQASTIQLVWREFQYPAEASATPYGPSCHPGASIQSNLPLAGSEFYFVDVAPVAQFELALFVIGFGQASIPVSPLGFAPGCILLVDPAGAFTLAHFTPNTSGIASLQLRLPDVPSFNGDLYMQAGIFPSSGTPFVTPGLLVRVR